MTNQKIYDQSALSFGELADSLARFCELPERVVVSIGLVEMQYGTQAGTLDPWFKELMADLRASGDTANHHPGPETVMERVYPGAAVLQPAEGRRYIYLQEYEALISSFGDVHEDREARLYRYSAPAARVFGR
ncbi:hypothetical protein U1Q18_049258 [Sarracenia purpurea var. burkii]